MKKVYKRLPMIVFLLFIGVMFVLFSEKGIQLL